MRECTAAMMKMKAKESMKREERRRQPWEAGVQDDAIDTERLGALSGRGQKMGAHWDRMLSLVAENVRERKEEQQSR